MIKQQLIDKEKIVFENRIWSCHQNIKVVGQRY